MKAVCVVTMLLLLEKVDKNWKTFAFANSETSLEEWKRYDWDRLTTVALFGEGSPKQELIAHARSKGCKVVKLVNVQDEDLDSESVLDSWVEERVKEAKDIGLDGANLDYEGAVKENSARSQALTCLLSRLVDRFHSSIPGSEVSVDVAWRPGCTDGRCYQYEKLAKVADLVFVMGYDLQSQMGESASNCLAKPNAPISNVTEGLRAHLNLSSSDSDLDKFVLGVPWYGYVYPCLSLKGDRCNIKSVPFRGVACSDAAGKQFAYSDVLSMQKRHKSKRQWSYVSETPFFNFKENGTWHQVHYDDFESLQRKYQLAKSLGIGGVGMWNANLLDYSKGKQIKDMWGAMPKKEEESETEDRLDDVLIEIV